MVPQRLVSLVPSFTETLRAWGHDPVACSQYCEQPDLLSVGGTKNPDIGAIVALAPDLVLLDREENRREDAEALEAAGIRLFVSDVRGLNDVGATLERLAAQLQYPAPDLSTDAPTGGSIEDRIRAFVPIWRRPWMTISAKTYGSELLASIGVDNVMSSPRPDGLVADSSGTEYPEVTLDEIRALGPDVVLAPSEPYEFRAAHLEELAAVAPVLEVDGQDLFWWGVRTPGARARLAAAISAR